VQREGGKIRERRREIKIQWTVLWREQGVTEMLNENLDMFQCTGWLTITLENNFILLLERKQRL
jgi:hypothetical protein